MSTLQRTQSDRLTVLSLCLDYRIRERGFVVLR